MKATLESIVYKAGLLLVALPLALTSIGQQPTYTVDQDFDTGELFRSTTSVADFHYLEDGKILVGGWYSGTVDGIARIFPNGSLDASFPYISDFFLAKIIPQEDGFVYCANYGFDKLLWDGTPWIFEHGDFWSDLNAGGTFNPYMVQRVYDIHQLENGDLLLAGAIGTDTLEPGIMRGLARLTADGTHDPSLPTIDLSPNNAGAAIRRIFAAPEGGWYASGGFTALNGHQTNHVAKLTENYEVDTNFTSPFMYDGPAVYQEDIIMVDSQSRLWISGRYMRLLENPADSIQIVRLEPNGVVDESFLPREMENNYPADWYFRYSFALGGLELSTASSNYLIYGGFSHFDGQPQPCITVLNEAGEIQQNYFQGVGASMNLFDDDDFPAYPTVGVVDELENGDLMIGGGFSEFMGAERYNVVRLKQGFLSTESQSRDELKIYPNPVSDRIFWSDDSVNEVSIYNSLGQLVLQSHTYNGSNSMSVEILESGFYVVVTKIRDRTLSQKLLINP
jgi:hypothetical protein